MGVSTQNGWFIIKMDDLGVPGTTIFGNIHIYVIYGRLMSKQISIFFPKVEFIRQELQITIAEMK